MRTSLRTTAAALATVATLSLTAATGVATAAKPTAATPAASTAASPPSAAKMVLGAGGGATQTECSDYAGYINNATNAGNQAAQSGNYGGALESYAWAGYLQAEAEASGCVVLAQT